LNRVLGHLPKSTAMFIYGYFRRILVIFVVTLHWPFYQECCYRTTNFQPDDCNKIHSFLVSHLFYFLFLLVDLFPVLLQRPRKEMVPSVWHFFPHTTKRILKGKIMEVPWLRFRFSLPTNIHSVAVGFLSRFAFSLTTELSALLCSKFTQTQIQIQYHGLAFVS